MPKLSIITVNLNDLAGLQKTIDSVTSQNFKNYEYIIIDGGSTDGSAELIEKSDHKLSYCVSEKDTGIYNAMNKGIVKSKGEYLLFLNSGDYLYSNESLQMLFTNSNNEDIIYGNLLVNELSGKQWIYNVPSILTFGFFYRSSLPHQATIIKRELFASIGLYNEELKISADWEFFLKAICTHNSSYKYIDKTISVFQMGGISTQAEFDTTISNERQKIIDDSYPAFVNEYKEYFSIQSELNDYKNSRAHQLIEKIITSPLYKKFKK